MRAIGAAAMLAALGSALLGLAGGALAQTGPLHVAPGGRYLAQADGAPFFWQGDTGWLMLKRLNREETLAYLDDRAAKGFNVVQVMVLHTPDDVNAFGAPALADKDVARPVVTPGADPDVPGEYDFWDHLDWAVDRAAERGIYLALVPAWGSLSDAGALNATNAGAYGRFLGERYGDRPNVIWLNGGDTRPETALETWTALGRALKAADPGHLMTFHPFGRTQSSTAFHAEPWLDFNMFQSGHRTYAQDPDGHGEDNWRFVQDDLARDPKKPTLDGEPSYEGIPHGLHDPAQPRWSDADARRYAWWSVFAGALGHTYGDNAVMQMHRPGVTRPAYGATTGWTEAIHDPGAGQMRHLKALMLSRPVFERVPDQSLIVDEGDRYDRILATRGPRYLMAYAYSGRSFQVRMGAIPGRSVRAWWYDPRTGEAQAAGDHPNTGVIAFDPPGEAAPGNDWALVLDDAEAGYGPPGAAPPA